jgi:hypothetical protein
MSIIAQQTNFTLHNTTKYFLEINISAEQDEEFRMVNGTNGNVIPIANRSSEDHGLFSTLMDWTLNVFTGKQLHEIKINIPAYSKVPIAIRCLTTLTFSTNIISKDVSDVITGDFILSPEYHGEPIMVEWKSVFGVGYDHSGEVAIGGTFPSKRDMSIDTIFRNKDNVKMTGIDITPACCKVTFK